MSDESWVDADPDVDETRNGAPKRRGRVKKRHTVARVLGISILVMALVTALSVVYTFRHLSANIATPGYEDDLENRPAKVIEGPKGPLNILVMGSDTRQGAGNKIDNETGEGGSDTTILIHLSGDRKHAYGISIPRDSMVDRPECKHGAIPAASYQQWNAAFAIGGPGCTMQQFEQLTGIRLDHYVVVKFSGFRDMVNAVNGVEVCIPEQIDDSVAHIHFDPGTQVLKGEQALNYVRLRHGVGDGSDIGRMKRQQAFIASMANKVISAGTLTRPDRVFKFLNAATKSIEVDRGLSNLAKIADLGYQFRNIKPSNIQFLTIPWTTDPQNPNRVVWAPEAQQVWNRILNDQPLSRRLTVGSISAGNVPGSHGGTPSDKPSSTPSQSAAADEAASVGLCS